jgi:hypothetical protein
MSSSGTIAEAAELKKHAERLAKALRLLLRELDGGCASHGVWDAVDFAEGALVAWRKRR